MLVNHNDYQAATLLVRQLSDIKESSTFVKITLEYLQRASTSPVVRDLAVEYLKDINELLNNDLFRNYNSTSNLLDIIFNEAIKTHKQMREDTNV